MEEKTNKVIEKRKWRRIKTMKKLILIMTLAAFHFSGYAQQKAIVLYPKGVPDQKQIPADYKEEIDENGYFRKVSQPELIPFFPKRGKANGTSVIICPGGGYELVVASDEGATVAKAFNQLGITAFVLKYRIPNEAIMKNKSIAPLQDAQMAILTVRERAKEWKLNPDKIGIVGLSAGGHLASTAGTHFATSYIENSRNTSLRPDFMVLIYPVISMEPWGGPRTRANLIGKEPTQSQIEFFSTERHATSNTPPTFLLHSTDDERITVRNSLVFYDALRTAKVKTEFHLLQNGGHGFGVEHPTRKDEWVKWCLNWLKENGF